MTATKPLPAALLDAAAQLERACGDEPWFAAVDPAVLDGVPVLFLVASDFQAALHATADLYQCSGYPLLVRRSNTLRAVVAAGQARRAAR